MKMIRLLSLAVLVLALSAGLALAEDINIVVAPNIVSIDSQGTVFTVHTDIAYTAVVGASVTLDGIPISWWKADSRGNFVAKFDLDAVKDILTAGETSVVTLTGVTTDGVTFSGTDEVLAIQPTGNR